jgi:DNA primase large subunit
MAAISYFKLLLSRFYGSTAILRSNLSSIRMGSGDLAKYPFLNEAGEYLRESGFGWDELDRPDMKDIIDRAAERIQIGVDGKIYDKLERYEIEIITFLISLLIVKSIGMEPVLRKFVLAEARRAEKFLTEDLKKQSEMQRHALFAKIFEDLFKLKINVADDGRLFKVRVVDYIARSSHFHENEWKLINRLVHNGYVYLDADETVRLIRNELSVLIYDKVKSMTLPSMPEALKSKADQLRIKLVGRYESRAATAVVTDYPPCIKHALEVMNKGENLPHSARVMLATYMLAIGKPVDEIVLMFENAPDFNEKITRYQVEHLAGIKGSRTKYSVPSCDKLRNENLCFATAACDGLINPIQFGRKKK